MLRYWSFIAAFLTVLGAGQASADSGKVRIAGFSLNDTAVSVSAALSGSADLASDISQVDCDPDPEIESLETFGFLSARVTLTNTTFKSFKVVRYRFKIVGQDGSTYQSPKFSTFVLVPRSTDESPSTSAAVVIGVPVNQEKRFYGSSSAISDTLGTAKVKLTVYYKPADGGATKKLSVTSTMLFANLDRCSN